MSAELLARIERLEAAVFRRMPTPEQDGWITNSYPGDERSLDMMREEFGELRIGEPKATPQRSAAALKKDGIVGVYLVGRE